MFTTGGVPSSATCTFLPSVDNHYNMGGQGSNVVIGNLDKMVTPVVMVISRRGLVRECAVPTSENICSYFLTLP